MSTAGIADQEKAPGDAEYPRVDAVNCDSCHQPHDANTNAGTFILDTATPNVPLAEGAGAPRTGSVNLYGFAYTRSTVVDNKWGKRQSSAGMMDSFCSQCHDW